MTGSDTSKGATGVVRAEWIELGPVGRTVVVALAMSVVAALVLVVLIPRQVETHLVDSHIRSLTRVVDEFAADGMIPTDTTSPGPLGALDAAVKLHLLGSDTVRVKVWLPDGTIAYSDEPTLVGKRFPLSEDRRLAFAGVPQADRPDLSRPENEFERQMPPLREFYIPVAGAGDETVAVFEVYHLAEPIDSTVANIRRYVWISVFLAIGLLAAFVAILIVVNGRAITRRQRLAENLLGELVRAQGEERTRIIGALHDDIGQSLYRIHYGIEDVLSRMAPDDPNTDELKKLGMLVNDVEGSLRAELRSLWNETGEELSLGFELDELAEVTEMETDLTVSVQVDPETELSIPCRAALFRAAREAVTNVRKHADASTIDIHVHGENGTVRLDVVDDGGGARIQEGLGLATTRERLEALGGGLRVRRARGGRGTHFEAWLPRAGCGVDECE